MQVGDHVLLKDYRSTPVGCEPVFDTRRRLRGRDIDGETAVRVRKIPTRPDETVREWMFVVEVLRPSALARTIRVRTHNVFLG